MSEIITLDVKNGIPTTTSLQIAERFGKRHDNVLQSIERLECSKEFSALNFQGCAYKGDNGKLIPMYAVTKDGFVFLAMGFTGKEAAAWKERYIAAFNAMERQLLEAAASSVIPQPDGQQFLSHRADIMVAADRTFRAAIRSGRSAGMATAAAIRRANRITVQKTGVDMLAELDIAEPSDAPAAAAPPLVQSVLDFWAVYEGGELCGACTPLTSLQAYTMYRKWCAAQVREPVHLIRFVSTLCEQSGVRRQRKRYYCKNVGDTVQSTFLYPSDSATMPDAETESSWLAECVERVDSYMEMSQ